MKSFATLTIRHRERQPNRRLRRHHRSLLVVQAEPVDGVAALEAAQEQAHARPRPGPARRRQQRLSLAEQHPDDAKGRRFEAFSSEMN